MSSFSICTLYTFWGWKPSKEIEEQNTEALTAPESLYHQRMYYKTDEMMHGWISSSLQACRLALFSPSHDLSYSFFILMDRGWTNERKKDRVHSLYGSNDTTEFVQWGRKCAYLQGWTFQRVYCRAMKGPAWVRYDWRSMWKCGKVKEEWENGIRNLLHVNNSVHSQNIYQWLADFL